MSDLNTHTAASEGQRSDEHEADPQARVDEWASLEAGTTLEYLGGRSPNGKAKQLGMEGELAFNRVDQLSYTAILENDAGQPVTLDMRRWSPADFVVDDA